MQFARGSALRFRSLRRAHFFPRGLHGRVILGLLTRRFELLPLLRRERPEFFPHLLRPVAGFLDFVERRTERGISSEHGRTHGIGQLLADFFLGFAERLDCRVVIRFFAGSDKALTFLRRQVGSPEALLAVLFPRRTANTL